MAKREPITLPKALSPTAKDRTAPDFEHDAMSVHTFARRHGLGPVKTYEEIAAGRLITMKVGRRRLISQEAAAKWRALCEKEVG
ncbi:MAG: hypothetical protein JJ903_15130 [Spongiibacter sp.]|uniref:hypothetical protein n=1 Tax=Spongiibacter TaxID=630749 RepID=UPI001AFEFB80|nr:hypothetical protein [Spongiibacter sp.]MBO6754399.1 hypothetical protein [Spongiibacter sp.]